MPTSNSDSSSHDVDLRRSSRIERPVALLVRGTNRRGESFQERTSAVSFNLHGCRYASRHDYPLQGWVFLQVTGTEGASAPPVRARVRSVLSGQSSRELCQVGVELETPGNIWGLSSPPEDWQRVLGSLPSGARAAAAVAPALDPSAPPSTFMRTPGLAPVERRAEVTVFPSPALEPPEEKEPVTFTPEQLLQALQGKLQLAAERAVDAALSTRLDESVNAALAKIEEGWKANVRHTEEFSAARLEEVQNRWEKELVVYRSRAEEISRRVESLAASSRQGLLELQKFAEHIKTELEPKLNARLEESLAKANLRLENNAEQLGERHQSKIAEFAQFAALQARSQLDETVAEARSLVSAAKTPTPSGVSEERLESLLNSVRESTLDRLDQRVADLWSQFEQQQDLARHRAAEIAQHVEMLTTQLNEAKAQHEQALADMRTTLGSASANVSPEHLHSVLKTAKEQILNQLEWRLGEVSGRADQQQSVMQQRSEELAGRLDGLAGDSRSSRADLDRGLGELRSLLASSNTGVSREQLDTTLNSVREQLLNHFEWRLGEVSGEFRQQHDGVRQRSEEIAQRLEGLSSEMRGQLEQSRSHAESLIQDVRAHEGASIEQVDRAARDFEVAAARISDRQLVRLMQQKQTLSTEASLELDARASEARVQLQKSTNSTLDEARRRVEEHVDLIVAEATERVTSSLATLDAESRATCEARRRDVEAQVAHAAEQSMAEFRSGIKAFLYSCLVAAVNAVDQHAQTTLAGLGKDPAAVERAIEESAEKGSDSGSSSGASQT